jgi:formate hydrogenlyase subunit 3/multisubunit Na+/H+ antiporter MnhD subunit
MLTPEPLFAHGRGAMNKSIAGGIAFVLVGLVFIILGSGGQRAYLPIGMAFALIGVIFIVRQRRMGRLK